MNSNGGSNAFSSKSLWQRPGDLGLKVEQQRRPQNPRWFLPYDDVIELLFCFWGERMLRGASVSLSVRNFPAV